MFIAQLLASFTIAMLLSIFFHESSEVFLLRWAMSLIVVVIVVFIGERLGLTRRDK